MTWYIYLIQGVPDLFSDAKVKDKTKH